MQAASSALGTPLDEVYIEWEESQNECWLLVLSYVRDTGVQNVADGSALPLSPFTGYSHRLLRDLGIKPAEVAATRWYCTSSDHSRTLHFRSTSRALAELVVDGSSSTLSLDDLTSESTTLLYADHTARLPLEATHSDGGAARLTDSAMAVLDGVTATVDPWGRVHVWGSGSHHWSLPTADSPLSGWECDESALGRSDHATTHQVWVQVTLLVAAASSTDYCLLTSDC